jgi:hypothetical protein
MSLEVQQIDLEAAQFKADATVQTGLRVLEFYAAAFSKTPDSNGDIIDPHAFDGWLQEFYAAGKPLPISFSHAAVLDGLDPTNTIGYAPADPQHVWVDDYGLRVRGFLDTASEKGKAVEWQIENNLMGGASIAYLVPPEGRVPIDAKAGTHRIMVISSVRETGPTPNPANQEAVLLWMKSEHFTEVEAAFPYMTVDEFRTAFFKTVDTSAWDKNTALVACETAAQFGEICAAVHTTGKPDERQHYALPHHYLGKGPNEAGVKAALARVGQVQAITDAERSKGQSHLEAHMKEINPDYQPPKSDGEVPDVAVEIAEIKHAASPTYIQNAHDALVRAGAKCADAGAEMASAPRDEVAERLRRLRFMKITTT